MVSEQQPEIQNPRETIDLSAVEHAEQRSITGSGQTIGIEPGENFIAPTMALDSLDQESTE